MIGDPLEKLIHHIAATIGDALEQRIGAAFTRYLKREVKMIYTEKEAAEFLGTSKDALASWRKDKLITFAQYPKGRAPKGREPKREDGLDGLGDTFTYLLPDLLNFRERYVQRALGANRFQLSPIVTPMGAEVEDRKLRMVG